METINTQIYTNIFSFDLEFLWQNKTFKWAVFTYLHSYNKVFERLFCVATFASLHCSVCISFSTMLSRSVCFLFSDNTTGGTSPPGKPMMQYSSMASKSILAKRSFPSASFESSAGLETNSSYSCRASVHRVR